MANVYLWLGCGQSNRQGNPPDLSNKLADGKPAPNNKYPTLALEWEQGYGLIPLSDNRDWSYTSDYRAFRGSMDPAFFNTWVEASGTKNVLVRCAISGTSVLKENAGDKGHWDVGETNPALARFDAAIARATAARAAITAAGDTVVAINVIWHGGEADALHGENLTAFKAVFENLLPRFRTALSWPSLKMYVARVGRPEWSKYAKTSLPQKNLVDIRKWQTEACSEVSGMLLAYDKCILFPKPDTDNPQGLNWMSKKDGVHYSQDGYDDMGFEMAKFIAIDLGVTPPDPEENENGKTIPVTSWIGRRLFSALN